jgi:hypothetical protein
MNSVLFGLSAMFRSGTDEDIQNAALFIPFVEFEDIPHLFPIASPKYQRIHKNHDGGFTIGSIRIYMSKTFRPKKRRGYYTGSYTIASSDDLVWVINNKLWEHPF